MVFFSFSKKLHGCKIIAVSWGKHGWALLKKKEMDRIITQRDRIITQRDRAVAQSEGCAALQCARVKHRTTQPFQPHSPHCAECIIFSKDRALQLHALLASFQELVTPSIPIHILYQASTPAHLQAYDDVKALFPHLHFTLQTADNSFRDDLLHILSCIASERLFFLVDDIVFTDKVDLQVFCQYDTDVYHPSLRMGRNITHSFPKQQKMVLPELLKNPAGQEDQIFWRWHEGTYDWTYPLSVDGHIFATWEIIAMTQYAPFKAPNSFERILDKLFRPLFACRIGVAPRKSCLVNIASNRVQDESANFCGEVHQDFLLEQWQKGLQMDYHALDGYMNTAPHIDIPLRFIPRAPQLGQE